MKIDSNVSAVKLITKSYLKAIEKEINVPRRVNRLIISAIN